MSHSAAAEFVLKAGATPVFITEPYGSVFSDLINHLGGKAGLQVVGRLKFTDIKYVVGRVGSCVVLAHVEDLEQAQALGEVLKTIKTSIHRKETRVLVTSSARSPNIKSQLIYHGCSEVLQEPIGVTKLASKIQSEIEAIPHSLLTSSKGGAKARYRWVDPVDIKSDPWSIREKGIELQSGVWRLQIEGPEPALGSWAKLPSADPEQALWQWSPAHLKNMAADDGAWVFQGRRPEFKGDHWVFTGKTPNLSFILHGESHGAKIKTDPDGSLLLARTAPEEPKIEVKKDAAPPSVQNQPKIVGPGVRKLSEVNPKLYPPSHPKFKPEGPSALKAKRKPGQFEPTLSPLALAFLLSELVAHSGIDRMKIAERYCSYLSASCNDSHAELWVYFNGKWACAGSSDQTKTNFEAQVTGFSGKQPVLVEPGLMLAPIFSDSDSLIGSVVLSGKSVDRIKPEYVFAIGRVTRGLLLSFQEKRGGVEVAGGKAS